MSNDDDKTGFFPNPALLRVSDPNATAAIPTPGGRGRRRDQEPGVPTPPGAMGSGMPREVEVALKGQSNPFLSSASKLITVLCAVSNSMSHPNVAQLQQELAAEIGNLDSALHTAGIRNEEALTARYILCAAIDEAVVNTPWGLESGWRDRALLRIYHNDSNGGERFFTLLESPLNRPGEYRDLLELFYVLLCMGFKGKYRVGSGGDAHLDTLRERVHQQLYSNSSFQRALSEPSVSTVAETSDLRSRIPLWVVLSVSLAFTLLVYTGLRAWMFSGSVDIASRFNAIFASEQSH